ncbi:Thiosulfate sulfurtransferase GlpE [Paenibacillus plantiphilus]|uniref:Thiosulfate sulfurtransferase GlpE n=1 Tax=Paenibacillus plantiphilus TaxID=2905650 RepID=A0ABN8GLY2_9BACL|nr:sulfurtransferase TusA family protein [Paenibacillus plantiphilus]CAH1209118.1 Thiosulfate sulfurtransferase GlpE [Paenibacillus plantiphilus]
MKNEIRGSQVLDCRGLACPLPIVKTKKAIDTMIAGEVIEVQATDKGSLADFKSWAGNTGHQYLGTLHDGDVLKHFIRKAAPDETRDEVHFAHVIDNAELQARLQQSDKAVVLDVREHAEYGFNHIPGAISIPLGELESRWSELDARTQIYVICRTGRRSDTACQLLHDRGLQVVNVIPGMAEWSGATEASARAE